MDEIVRKSAQRNENKQWKRASKTKEQKTSSKAKTPYFRDVEREKDRLTHLYGDKHHSTRFKSRDDKSTKSVKSTKNNSRIFKNSINPKPQRKQCSTPQVVYVPIPLVMANPLIRFTHFPVSMPSVTPPMRLHGYQYFPYSPIPRPTYGYTTNNYGNPHNRIG